MMLLTIPTFDLRQTVIPVAEAPTMPCPRCNGHGYWFDANPIPTVRKECPDCTDGRVPLVGRIAIAVPCSQCLGVTRFAGDEYKCRTCWNNSHLIVASAHVDAVVPVLAFSPHHDESPHVCLDPRPDSDALLYPGSDEREHGDNISDQLTFATFTPGQFALVLTDVQPTTDRCPGCWGEGSSADDPLDDPMAGPCLTCLGYETCPPIPVAAGEAWREWPT